MSWWRPVEGTYSNLNCRLSVKFSKRLKRERTLKIEIQHESENKHVEEVEENEVVELHCEVVIELANEQVENPVVVAEV